MAEEDLTKRFKDIKKKYKLAVEGSIERGEANTPHAGKITVLIKCKTKDCPNTRRVATSDLWQVKMCEQHTLEARAARRKQRVRK